jgi:hypothetical protein
MLRISLNLQDFLVIPWGHAVVAKKGLDLSMKERYGKTIAFALTNKHILFYYTGGCSFIPNSN